MNRTWRDPFLGEMVREPTLHEGMSWSGVVDAPAFDVFRFGVWMRAYVKDTDELPKGKYELSIYGKNAPKDAPADAAVALAVKLIERQEAVVALVIAAVKDELHGRGPDSGMWWYNGLNKPDTAAALGRSFDDDDDVKVSLRLSGIIISNEFWGVGRYAANLWFDSEFEEEHDFCVLTDGEKVLGTGYLDSPMAYGFRFDEE